MKKLHIIFMGLVGVWLAPSVTFAQSTVLSIVRFMVSVINQVLLGFMMLVLVYFFWGLAKYISNVGDEKKEAEGRAIMTWGVLAVFIAVSLWGIIGWLQTFIGNPIGPTAAETQINLPHV